MNMSRFPSGYLHFIILAPIIMKPVASGDYAMSASDVMKAFVGNTVVTEHPEGPGYDYVQSDGKHIGLHPRYGKVLGSWHVDSDGEACVTWGYPSGSITNCSPLSDLGGGKFQWGDQTLLVQRGDVKGLGE